MAKTIKMHSRDRAQAKVKISKMYFWRKSVLQKLHLSSCIEISTRLKQFWEAHLWTDVTYESL